MLKLVKKIIKLPYLFWKFCKEGKNISLSVSYVNAENRFKGKHIFVSGGTSGIGLAIAKAFLSEGADVLIAARNSQNLDNVRKCFADSSLKTMTLDVADIASIKEKIQEADRLMNGIDVFVNCAGVSAYDGNIFSEEMYDYICGINQKGLFYMNKEEGDYMIAKSIRGKIVNLTSKAGERIAFDPYTLSKWGANSITYGNARRLAKYHINVNGIAPGRVPTNITKELQSHKDSDNVYTTGNETQRFTMPEEVAAVALFLASGAANNIVGQVIVMDGGSYH